eukprot:GILI01024173.1.p1 GENE.GILI01024173.1~~GILI01024173.1.p1  ORF type:complete len:125 (+),score=18.27 GILI01024173.1:59-433(+)
MRLLTHNLMCCLKCKHFPLDVAAADITTNEQTFDREFVQRMLGRVEFAVLANALEQVRNDHQQELSEVPPLPATVDDIDFEDDSQLNAIHLAMSAIMIRNGKLVCPACTTEYPITEFIPNLMVE